MPKGHRHSLSQPTGHGTPVGPWPGLAELKAWLRVPDDREDELLEQLCVVAVASVQERCGDWWEQPPVPVAQAALMHAGRLWKRRDSLDGTIGLPDIGLLQVGRYDADVDGLLWPFRQARFA